MSHIKPMLATLTDKTFDNPNWIFEIKWDGFRAIAEIKNHKVELYSRNLLSFNEKFEPIVKTLSKLSSDANSESRLSRRSTLKLINEVGTPTCFAASEEFDTNSRRRDKNVVLDGEIVVVDSKGKSRR